MTTEISRESLELEKFHEELLTELSRRHHWGEQDRLLLGTFILGVIGLIFRGWWT